MLYAVAARPVPSHVAPPPPPSGGHHHQTGRQAEPQQVTLHRADGQKWGFRLQGGADYRTQLSVMRVQPGSPAQGKLHAGDAIHSVNGQKSRTLTHTEASNVIKESGNSLVLVIVKQQAADQHLFEHIRPQGRPKFTKPMA